MNARPSLSHVFVAIFIGALTLNTAYLNYVLFVQPRLFPQTASTITKATTPAAVESDKSCTPSCVSLIQTATASALAAVPPPSPATKTVAQKTTSNSSVPKTYYIPLGTGFTQNNDWVDVGGTDTTLNPADYGKIKQVTFEASMHIPVANGTMYARLYNVTDKHPVWFSEVSTSAGTSTSVSSGNMTLDSGSKLYRVQIKTSLQYPSYLDFSRIVILIQ